MIDVKSLDLKIEDIPSEQMQSVAYRCGMSDAISLMSNVPGLELYIPISGKKAIAYNYIKLNANDSNISTVAGHLGITREKVKLISKKIALSTDEKNILTTESMLIIAEKCGEDIAIRLLQHFHNSTLYVPKNGFSIAIRKYIERNHNGFNTATLALKCGVTERYVRQIIADLWAPKIQQSLDLGI